jgi:hypothetical protein
VIIIEMAEEKNTVDPTPAGFYEAMKGPTLKKSLMRCSLGYLGIPATVIVLMWKVVTRMPKIGHGDRVMLFLESLVLNKDILKG